MQEKSVLIILNPRAGRGRAGILADSLLAGARALGWSVDLRLTRHPGEEVELGRAACAEGWPVVLAAGGDGTVHGVANGLLASGPPTTTLAHVPIGTGNDFAKTVGLDKARHPERNLALVLQGTQRALDVGHVMGEYFLNSCGVGFGPEVVRRTFEFAHLRGFPLYVAAATRAFFAFDPAALGVAAEEHCQHGSMLMVEASIGKTTGGGFKLTPEAEPDDGLLDVCIIGEVPKVRFLRYLLSGLRGTLSRLDHVTVFRTARVTIEAEQTPYMVHLDGELRESVNGTITMQIVPGMLPVLCAPR